MSKKWSLKYDSCKACGTTDEKHNAKGLCRLCYSKADKEARNPRKEYVCVTCDKTFTAKTAEGMGGQCRSCYMTLKRWSKDRDSCAECGESSRPHMAHGLCTACCQRSMQRTEYVCEECGKPFVGCSNSPRKYGILCGPCATSRGHGLSGKRYSKKTVVEKLEAVIKDNGKYTSRLALQEATKISDRVWTRLGLSCPELNDKVLGKDALKFQWHGPREEVLETVREIMKDHGDYVSMETLQEVYGFPTHLMQSRGISLTDLNKEFGYRSTQCTYRTKEELEEAIVALIRRDDAAIPVYKVLQELRIDYATSIVGFDIDMRELYDRCGVRPTLRYHEELAFTILREWFGKKCVHREKWFSELVSGKGHRLRFDFFLPDQGVLVEIDGEQHYDDTHHFYRKTLVDNDKRKAAFAKRNGYKLIRVRIKTHHKKELFIKYLRNRLVRLGIVKPL